MNPPVGQESSGAISDANAQQLLRQENSALRDKLREAEETLEAIRNGDVDAVVVSGIDDVPRVYTLETADQTYRLLVEEMQEGALTLTRRGDILYCNRRLAELVETEPERVIGGSLARFIAAADWPNVLDLIASGSKGELAIKTERGRVIPTHVSFSALRAEGLNSEEIHCCIITDLTEQRSTADQLRGAHAALLAQVSERERTERLLRQSQKMEAVGQLTGGIAHDFNNLLMVISGGLSILDREPTPERRQLVREGMRQAAERGAALTRQLLAFSRQKELFAKPLAIPRHVEGMRELLDGSLGGSVTIKTAFDADVWPVRVDEGELGIALLNLCVNARDAMPQGGTITIAAVNRANIQEYGLTGDFVELSVRDTGVGMDPETIARCLEPFYTTKDIGKGSGLGLAQVYGFAHGSGGSVQIESKADEGTKVLLLLPRSEEAPSASPRRMEPRDEVSTCAPALCRVLLVEDDVQVASLTSAMLTELGYEVIPVTTGQAALNELAATPGIGLVLSDVMMPGGMDGMGLVREMRQRRISLPVVLVSGFSAAAKRDAEDEGIPLLPKPYTLRDLAAQLTSALSTPRARGHSSLS
ncbi:MAG TPA: ATP-binding protein [Steroidobacteraceae bacterium]|jgi:PAS domain S-box-containing protein|nr:ATP-binding protein [Steroidobacteraceae bacterium]